MKKWFKRILTVVILITIYAGMIKVPVYAESGNCGKNLKWTLENGVLRISGTGEINYNSLIPPWNEVKPDIRKIIIEEGVTGIREFAFADCINLTTGDSSAR